jgi:hypothetical protein
MNNFYEQNPAFLKAGTIYSIPEPPKKEWKSSKGMTNGSAAGENPLMPAYPTNGNLQNDDTVTSATTGGGGGAPPLFKEVYICENGEPVAYNFYVES